MLISSLARRVSRRLPEIGLGVLLSTALTGTALALTSDRAALAPHAERLWGDSTDPLRGAEGSQVLQTSVPVPDLAARVRALSVGVMTYNTEGRLLCFAAGPVRDGRVGLVTRSGFDVLDASDAPGPCGDNRENLVDMGGIALAQVSSSELDVATPQAIVYGLVADLDTVVRVTWPDGKSVKATVRATAERTDLHGAAGTFVAAGPVGQLPDGARVSLLRPDGTQIHSFDL